MALIDSDILKGMLIREVKNYILTRSDLAPEYYVDFYPQKITLLEYLSDYYYVLESEYNSIEFLNFIEWLLINGANPNQYSISKNPLLTLYMMGYDMRNKNDNFTRIFLKHGANPNIRSLLDRNTSLYRCVINTSNFIDVKPIVKTLIDYGASIVKSNTNIYLKPFKYFVIVDRNVYRNKFYDNYDENIKHTDNIFERLWKDLEIAVKKRRVKKFLLKYVVLNPKSKYIIRLISEFN
jgi:ankyrin repeat protein